MNKDYGQFKAEFYETHCSQRLGQHFVNKFIRQSWPELYNEENDVKADRMIRQWLTEHHYFVSMPKEIKRNYKGETT